MGQQTDAKILLAKLESVAGTDSLPDGANNAIVIEDDVTFNHEVMTVERNNAKGWFGQDQKLIYGKKLTVKFAVEGAGSGTAGVEPKWGTLIKACGFGGNVLATAHTGTATAGSAGSITLAAGASAVNDGYKYMLIRITGGTGAGQTRCCKAYVGASKVLTPYKNWATPPDATSIYALDAQVMYNPIGTSTSNTIYFYYLGKLHKLLMSRGSVSISQKAGQKRRFMFDFQGLYGGIVDAVFPAVTLVGWVDPLVVNFANTARSELHGFVSFCYELTIDIANKIVYRNVPGVEDILFTDREPKGSIEIEDPLIAAKDFPAIINASTLGDLLTQHGTVAGNIVGEYLPNVSLDKPSYGDQDGQGTLKLDMCIPPTYGVGNDEVLIYAK